MTVPFDPASLGTDLNIAMGDVPGAVGLATGLLNLGNAHVRRLCCPPGGLFYDDDYGYDVTGLLNASLGPADIAKAQGQIASEIEKDERVDTCVATVVLNQATEELTITLVETLVTGQTFAFVMAANRTTVALLQINGVSVAAAVTGAPAAPGVQLVVGPAGQQGGPGLTGADGASGTPQLTLDFDNGYGTTASGNEDVLYQRMVNFDALPATVTFDLNASVSSTAGISIFQMSYGGTRDNADGTNVGSTITTASPTFVRAQKIATIANPGGQLLVKITGKSSAAGQTAAMADDRTLTIR